MNGTHSKKEEGDRKDAIRAMVPTGRSEKAGSQGNTSSHTPQFLFTRITDNVEKLSWLGVNV